MSLNDYEQFETNQEKADAPCHFDGENHDRNKEDEEDILNGDFEAILKKLEDKGAGASIFKYKEMAKLRTQRNRRVQDKLNVYGIQKSVIDSSQVVGAQ